MAFELCLKFVAPRPLSVHAASRNQLQIGNNCGPIACMGWTDAVVVVGPESVETSVVHDWAIRNCVETTRVPLSQGLDPRSSSACALVVLDALEDPPLAVAECARFRSLAPSKPVLFLGAQGRSLEQAALRAGTTAFLDRPLAADRLRSYVERFFLRSSTPSLKKPAAEVVELAFGTTLDVSAMCLIEDGAAYPLTSDRFRLLQYLVTNPGRAINSAELVRKEIILATQAPRYRSMVFDLRRQLRSARDCITLVRGFGYRFDFANQSSLTGNSEHGTRRPE
jgi:DNA-binding response OmpR family regulator